MTVLRIWFALLVKMEHMYVVVQQIVNDSFRTILGVFANKSDAASVVEILSDKQDTIATQNIERFPDPLELEYYVEKVSYHTSLSSFSIESAKIEQKRLHDAWDKRS